MKTSQVKCRQDNVRRARRAVEDGQYRKAIQALTSGGLAPSSPEVLAEMLAKHPQSAPTPTPAGPSPSPAVFSEADVIKAVKSFPGGSAPGPLGFALTLQPIMEHILSEVPGLKINVWYLDDGTLCGSPDDLAKALKLIEDEGPALGLDLNPSSTSLRMPILISTPYHPTSHPICGDGFVLLGCPIGPPSFCEVTMLRRVEKVKDAHLTWRIRRRRPPSLGHALPSPRCPSRSGRAPQAISTMLWTLSTIPCRRPFPTFP